MSSKGIVMLASPSPSNAIIFNHLAPRFEMLRVIVERRLSRFAVFRKRVKKFGALSALGQAAFRSLIYPVLELTSRKRVRQIAAKHNLRSTAIPENVITRVESANSADTIALLKQLNPAVVIVNGTRILSIEVLEAISAKFINLHAGITPHYRGVHGAYWALVEGRSDLCGVTVHEIDIGIDTGPVLAQAAIHPTFDDNFVTYQMLQLAACLPLLDSVLPNLLEDLELAPLTSTEPSKLWSHPTAGEYIRNRIRRGVK